MRKAFHILAIVFYFIALTLTISYLFQCINSFQLFSDTADPKIEPLFNGALGFSLLALIAQFLSFRKLKKWNYDHFFLFLLIHIILVFFSPHALNSISAAF